MALPRCELCGMGSSACDNERFDEYKEKLFRAAVQARDERALVFMATDELSKLDELHSSARVLPHEEDDDYYTMFNGRYANKEASIEKIESALKFLNSALESLGKDDGKSR